VRMILHPGANLLQQALQAFALALVYRDRLRNPALTPHKTQTINRAGSVTGPLLCAN
jgi:hypothetical protein